MNLNQFFDKKYWEPSVACKLLQKPCGRRILSELYTIQARNTTISSTVLIRYSFKKYRCELDIRNTLSEYNLVNFFLVCQNDLTKEETIQIKVNSCFRQLLNSNPWLVNLKICKILKKTLMQVLLMAEYQMLSLIIYHILLSV